MKTIKKFILDTNVVIDNPLILSELKDSEILLPTVIFSELDKHKNRHDDAGKNSRTFIRIIESLRKIGNLKNGIEYLTNFIRIVNLQKNIELPKDIGDVYSPDNMILAICKQECDCVLLTNDILLRIKSEALEIQSEEYTKVGSEIKSIYSGDTTVFISKEEIDKFYEDGSLILTKEFIDSNLIMPNQLLVLKSDTNSAVGRYRADMNAIVPIFGMKDVFGLQPKNKEQQFAMDLLFDRGVSLVTLTGPSGTGKTIISIAAGLQQVMGDAAVYEKLIIIRPIQPVGKDIGFLPGSLEEKLEPWIAPIKDNLNHLFGQQPKKKKKTDEPYLSLLFEKGIVEIQAMTYIRGRSISNSMIIVDECFPADQFVATETGKIRIGQIYKKFQKYKKIPLVKTFNESTNNFEFKKVIGARKKENQRLMKITCANREIKCTPNHKFLGQDEWISAEQLKIGTLLKTSEPKQLQMLNSLNDDQYQIVLGSFLGDGNIDYVGNNRYRLCICHGIKQKEYCQWKAKMFDTSISLIKENGYSKKEACRMQTKVFGLDGFFPKTKRDCPQWILDRLDARGLAIWFMDDGSVNPECNSAQIWTSSFDFASQIRIVNKLQSFGIECNLKSYHSSKKNKNYSYIYISVDGYSVLCDLVAPYIHENLQYKFNVKDGTYNWNNKFNNFGLTVVDKLELLEEYQDVYDIEVEDNHNFIVCSQSRCPAYPSFGGIIAHNCQNISKSEIKAIITRAGYGTKIVLTGDLEQLDNFSLDMFNNGLTHVVERFKYSPIAGHISLTKGVRSELATIASEIL